MTTNRILPAFILVAFFGLFIMGGCRADFSLTVIHTGSTFAQITAVDQLNSPCVPKGNGTYAATKFYLVPCLGGMDRRATVVRELRENATAAGGYSVLIDSGALFTGSVFWYLYNSTIMAKYYNQLGYDAIGPSLYEYLQGVNLLAYFVKHINGTPVVTTNLENASTDPRLTGAPIYTYAVIEIPNSGGQRVGFAATVQVNMASLVFNAAPLDSTTELLGMLMAVGELQNMGINKIIAQVSGVALVDSIVNSVPGIDIVILNDAFYGNTTGWQKDSEAPTGEYPQVYNVVWNQPVLVVGSGNFGKYVGALNVVFNDQGVITSWSGNTIQLSSAIASDPVFYQSIVDDFTNEQIATSQVIGRTSLPLSYDHTCLFGECAIGDWAADVFRSFGRTQIGLCNGGSISGGIGAGNITLGDYLVDFPFVGQNQLWTFYVTGGTLLQVLEHSVALATTGLPPSEADTGRFLQVSGLNFTWNPDEAPYQRIVDVWIEVSPGNWELLTDNNALYNLTTLDYLAKGGDFYDIFITNSINITNTLVFAEQPLLQSLNDSLANPLHVVVGGRITNSTASRATCYSSTVENPVNGTLCNGNGYCLTGQCQCTVAGASGSLCVVATSTDSSSSLSSGSIAGIVIGSVVGGLCILLITIIVTAVVVSLLRKNNVEQEWIIDFEELEIGELLGRGGCVIFSSAFSSPPRSWLAFA